ncbi:PAS domain-containing protein [Pseudomonas aeruginosa]|nr:PAS domain-containing protein [Pseudomonas aeruginosa]
MEEAPAPGRVRHRAGGPRNHLQGLTDNLDHIYRLRHKDGDYRWIHSRGRVLRDALASCAPGTTLGVACDITLQRLKEDHPRQAAAVPTSTREGVLVTDAQAVIVHANLFERITGYRSAGRARQDPGDPPLRPPGPSVLPAPVAGPARAGRLERRDLEPSQRAARSTRSGCTSARCATTRAN